MEAASHINDELISCTSSTLLNQYHKKAIASLGWKLTIIFDRFAQSCTPASHRSVHKAGTPILACILRVFNRDSGFGILAPAIMLHKPIIACFKRSLLWLGPNWQLEVSLLPCMMAATSGKRTYAAVANYTFAMLFLGLALIWSLHYGCIP